MSEVAWRAEMIVGDFYDDRLDKASRNMARAGASMRSTLANIASMLGTTIEACPWHTLRFAHVAALRAVLAERFAPATTNKYLSAIRQVMRQAWLLGLMDGEDYQRAAAVRNVKGSRLPAGARPRRWRDTRLVRSVRRWHARRRP